MFQYQEATVGDDEGAAETVPDDFAPGGGQGQ